MRTSKTMDQNNIALLSRSNGRVFYWVTVPKILFFIEFLRGLARRNDCTVVKRFKMMKNVVMVIIILTRNRSMVLGLRFKWGNFAFWASSTCCHLQGWKMDICSVCGHSSSWNVIDSAVATWLGWDASLTHGKALRGLVHLRYTKDNQQSAKILHFLFYMCWPPTAGGIYPGPTRTPPLQGTSGSNWTHEAHNYL